MTSDEIQIGKVGRILEGVDKGYYLLIEPAVPGADDFLLHVSASTDFRNGLDGGDMWCESKEKLPVFFKEAGWKVEWLGNEGEV